MFRLLILLVVSISGLASAPGLAFAAKPRPEVFPISESARASLQGAPGTSSLCQLGEKSAVFSVNYILPPDDGYYTLLSPSLCGGCPGALGGVVSAVDVGLYIALGCTQPVTVSIVGAMGPDTCRAPDPLNVICLPVGFNLAGQASGGDITFFNLPLPAPCRFVGDAFLCVKFGVESPACTSATTRPRLVVSGSCQSCRSYNIYPAGNDEICTVQLPGNPTMWAELSACLDASADVGPGDGVGAPGITAVMPNPGNGRELSVLLDLAESGAARLELYDLLGHLIARRDLGSPGAGTHRFDLGRGLDLRPGMYVVRLVQGARAVARKAIVVR